MQKIWSGNETRANYAKSACQVSFKPDSLLLYLIMPGQTLPSREEKGPAVIKCQTLPSREEKGLVVIKCRTLPSCEEKGPVVIKCFTGSVESILNRPMK